jgi:hypothetical protein
MANLLENNQIGLWHWIQTNDKSNGKRRIGQIENTTKLIKKILILNFIHCGLDHVIVKNAWKQSWGKALAGRLKKNKWPIHNWPSHACQRKEILSLLVL